MLDPPSIDESVRRRVESLIESDAVVLFMKGTRSSPQCGFSAATVEILDGLLEDYVTVDVLASPELREGVKAHADWPTIPQLYVGGEFVGGSDIVRQLHDTGELHEMLELPAPDLTAPRITVSDAAARIMREALEGAPDHRVHLSIDRGFEHRFALAPVAGHEIVARAGDLDIHLDLASARRARGLHVDVEEGVTGAMLRIENPNAPPPVRSMTVHDLAGRMRRGEPLTLVDVRTPGERECARIEPSVALDADGMSRLEALPRDATVVFYCHHGQRSRVAAEHFRNLGFTAVHNLEGGIDAWSLEVDPVVPRY